MGFLKQVFEPSLFFKHMLIEKVKINNDYSINDIHCIANIKTLFLHDRKTILQDIVKYSDFTTDKFQEIHRRMQKAVDSVKPVEEYRDFIGSTEHDQRHR